MKISKLADQVREIPLREVLTLYGFEARPEGSTLRARSEQHNIVVTGSRWFDNKAGVGGAGAIDLLIHIAKVDFSAACRALAGHFRPAAASQRALSFSMSRQQPAHPERKSFEELAALYDYFHALSRFDRPAKRREKDNLIILFADEGQEIVTSAESAFADHRAAGIIREAKATIVLATQAYTSLLGALDTWFTNLRPEYAVMRWLRSKFRIE